MKLPSVLLFSIFPFLTIGTPIVPSDNGSLEPRADKWCELHSTVGYDVGCFAGAGTGYRRVRWIKAADVLRPSDRFGVRCKAFGELIGGNQVWDKIPGWGCWVSAHYTNTGCESKSKCDDRQESISENLQLVYRGVESGTKEYHVKDVVFSYVGLFQGRNWRIVGGKYGMKAARWRELQTVDGTG